MESFLKLQSILAQMVSGATKAASGDTLTESEDAEMELDGSEGESEDTLPLDPLADSRNRVPALGGPYISPVGLVPSSKEWRRS